MRHQQGEISDLDLCAVVRDTDESELLRDRALRGEANSSRYGLFRQFGEPALIHENPSNAPPGGTFTFVLYTDAQVIDWTLFPLSSAERPLDAIQLFSHAPIPTAVEQPAAPPSADHILERWSFAWMMLAVAGKFLVREDYVYLACMFHQIDQLITQLEAALAGKPHRFRSGSTLALARDATASSNQFETFVSRLARLKPLVHSIAPRAPDPSQVVLAILSLAHDA